MNYRQILLSIFLLATVSACSSALRNEEIIPPQESYDAGVEKLLDGAYKKAADAFEKVFFQHPGNHITPQAELMQAYSLYLAGEYDDSIDVLTVFIKLHPRHPDVVYAYYLIGLNNYVQISSVKLDQSRTKYAKESFQVVINRFPATKYAVDAALKMDLIDDHLAGKEMEIGRYYLSKKNPIAAIKRFQNVLDQYNATTHVMEALYRLIEVNVMLGLRHEGMKYAEVLEYNYPDSYWHNKAQDLLE